MRQTKHPPVSTNEELMNQWCWEENNKNGFDPNKITLGSHKKVFWICAIGHKWKSTICNEINGNKCPICLFSKAANNIYNYLFFRNLDFEIEYSFNDLIMNRKLRFDFAVFINKKIVLLIEYQGEYHNFNDHFEGKDSLERIKKSDFLKKEYCVKNKIPLLEIKYYEENIIKILEKNLIKYGIINE